VTGTQYGGDSPIRASVQKQQIGSQQDQKGQTHSANKSPFMPIEIGMSEEMRQ